MKNLSAVFMFFLLSGCGIGGFWMNGDPSGGMNITPLRDYWEFPGKTAEERTQQWIDCGGGVNGDYIVQANGLRGKEVLSANNQKFDDLQYCMMKNGYRYTGTCEGQIPSQYPACKAQ